jgi:glutaredoxin
MTLTLQLKMTVPLVLAPYVNMKTIYSMPNCSGCVALKEKLKAEGELFYEIMIGTDISLEEFKEKFPSVRSVPFVVESQR